MNSFTGSVASTLGGGVGGGVITDSLNSLSTKLGLAEGGVVSRPTQAIIGEGGQPEVVAPFSKFAKMLDDREKARSQNNQEQQPTQLNIVNVVDPAMVDKAIMNNPNTVINVVAADIQGRGNLYTIMKSKR